MIVEVIELLHKNEFIGAGECTEIAKGKNEIVQDWATAKKKIKRIWHSKKK
jgi:hypothetical protein